MNLSLKHEMRMKRTQCPVKSAFFMRICLILGAKLKFASKAGKLASKSTKLASKVA
ncbi:hypothetical protein [Peribacillus sp. SI8-4]|uniref:hypothetical protein n=1 Tax=Peribacillus sp. SI8-4 TaxID=3048009 RepID=UPI002553800C|nr:hypothetical protein [Peribacillus sp. SI8-4]